jgi:hypothetical protein
MHTTPLLAFAPYTPPLTSTKQPFYSVSAAACRRPSQPALFQRALRSDYQHAPPPSGARGRSRGDSRQTRRGIHSHPSVSNTSETVTNYFQMGARCCIPARTTHSGHPRRQDEHRRCIHVHVCPKLERNNHHPSWGAIRSLLTAPSTAPEGESPWTGLCLALHGSPRLR